MTHFASALSGTPPTVIHMQLLQLPHEPQAGPSLQAQQTARPLHCVPVKKNNNAANWPSILILKVCSDVDSLKYLNEFWNEHRINGHGVCHYDKA